MSRIFNFLAVFIVAVTSAAAANPAIEARARRAYDAEEWASAQALYAVASENSTNPGLHARMMVAAEMLGDTAAAPSALERAMQSGVPVPDMLDSLELCFKERGRYDMYGNMLRRIAGRRPYLRRPVDARLLNYATSRRDGEAMIKYASRLLAGLPDNAAFIDALAWGQLYCGHYADAEATWRKGIEANPDNAALMINLGELLADSKPSEALELLKRAYILAPTPALAARIKSFENE